MRVFGWELSRVAKSTDMVTHLPAVSNGWIGLFGSLFHGLHEPRAGAWQRGESAHAREILTHSTVWSCITLIMQDIGKLTVDLIERDDDIWVPVENSAYSPVLRKPNHYQHHIKFFESWVCSKLTRGNTYVLKVRNNRGGPDRGNVSAMHVLDPSRVQVLVSPSGEVFYQLSEDRLAGVLEASVSVPATEIIHDVGVALYHPLCGLPPLVACALSAGQSLSIQETSSEFFANHSNPGGVLTAPQRIGEDTAKRIKDHWDANYSGASNAGKVAVLGDGLKYEPMRQTAVDSQLAEQLRWTDEKICSVFHVPPFMVGVGPTPSYNNVEALNQQYYSQCLQNLIECIEVCLDQGLGLSASMGVQFDLDGLIRMDSSTQMKNATDGIKGGLLAPNEARRKFNLRGVEGGEDPYLQQQNWSLRDLAKRREMGEVAKPIDQPQPEPPPQDEPSDETDGEVQSGISELTRRSMVRRMAWRHAA